MNSCPKLPACVGLPERPSSKTQRITSIDLMGQSTVIEIEHLGQVYRLRVTRQGKLILTK